MRLNKLVAAALVLAAAANPPAGDPSAADLGQIDNTKIAWGLGPSADAFGRPIDAVKAEKQYSERHALFVGEAERKRLWLTFDEGYENGYTEKILDVLKEKNVRAVFFVTFDYARDNPELIRRMIDEGHTVGNHTKTHPSLPECSVEEVRNELSETHDFIKREFGYDMYVMRPPRGEFSERVLECAKSLGYTTVLWSFAYFDWDVNNQPAPEAAFEKITSKTHPGAVYLLHAVSSANAEILGRVIDCWRSDGYVITPM